MKTILIATVGLIIVIFGFVVLRGAPYVPSHRRQLRRAFEELYQLGPGDRLLDLGSGDGVVLRLARRYGARALGYELNPILVLLTRILSHGDDGVSVRLRDYLSPSMLPSDVTVVYAFSTSHNIEAIGRKMVEWSEGREIYLISYGFQLAHREAVRSIGPMSLYLFKS